MATEIALTILEKLMEYTITPIGHHIGYLICYKSNVENLKFEVENLKTERAGKQQLVADAKRNAEVILPNVEKWLMRVEAIIEEQRTIFEGEAIVNKGYLKGWCPNLMGRHKLSRWAKKKTFDIIKITSDGKNMNKVSCPPPPLGIESIITGNFYHFESQLAKMEEVMDALKDDKINMIGICGMGGVGKTTMVKQLAIGVNAEKLFDEVVMAVVSQKPNLANIQDEIVVTLGLKLDDRSSPKRASQLRLRLLQDNKRILVILDDVWEKLDLEKIGIPFVSGQNGCKIIFTSRNQDVWSEIRNKVDIVVDVLTKQEACHLFQMTTGNSSDTPDLQPVAEAIVNECGCLPLALVTIGTALLHKSKHVWNDTLKQLRMPSLKSSSSGVPAKLYRSLELSYSYLEDKEAKSCFLLCCLFPEDFDILIETLVRCGIGLRLFEGISGLGEAARDRVHALCEKLRGCFLLLEGLKEESVRMHDVVRNVAISIASEDDNGFMIRYDVANLKELQEEIIWKRCASISIVSDKSNKLLEGFECPILQFLLLTCESLPDNLFEGMIKLNVLELRNIRNSSLPSSLTLLKNLRTLCIVDCWDVENVSVIGELEKLEILSFSRFLINELPKEIGQLTNLLCLDLNECYMISKIPPGVLSGLFKLQELHMRRSFINWELHQEGKERRNASLMELKSMIHLNVLEIRIPDPNLLPKDLHLINLRRYKILIGNAYNEQIEPSERNLVLCFVASVPFEGGINILLKSATSLRFEVKGLKNSLSESIQEGSKHLKHLKVNKSDTPDYFANAADLFPHPAFPVLDSLHFCDLPDLKEICHGQLSSGSFGKLRELELSKLSALIHLWEGPMSQSVYLGNLQSVKVVDCHSFGSLFPQSMETRLGQLGRLNMTNCNVMEEIISKEGGEDQATNKIEFPRLKELTMGNLPSLTSIFNGVDEITFPQLKFLSFSHLPMLKNFGPIQSSLASEGNHHIALQSLFNEKVKLTSLKELEVSGMDNLTGIWHGQLQDDSFYELNDVKVTKCGNILGIFPSNFIERLKTLEILKVNDCGSLEEIITKDEDGAVNREISDTAVVSRVEKKVLHALPNLTSFCHGNCCKIEEEIAEDDQAGENTEGKFVFVLPCVRFIHLSGLPRLMGFYPKMENFGFEEQLQHCLFNKQVEFPSLEVLQLSQLSNINKIWGDQLLNDLHSKLRVLKVQECDKLLIVAPSQVLTKLEEVQVINCSSIEEIFEFEQKNIAENPPTSSRLKELTLQKLPRFMHLSKNGKVVFPSLEKLELSQVGNLNDVWCNQLLKDHQGALFKNLVSLSVKSSITLRNLFSASMTKGIVHLKNLEIEDCMMEVGVANGVDEEEQEEERTLFPQLKSLILKNLPCMNSFCHMTYSLEWPLLEDMIVIDCPKLKTFSLGSINTPKLRGVRLNRLFNDQSVWMGNLNDTIRHLYKAKVIKLTNLEDHVHQMDSLINICHCHGRLLDEVYVVEVVECGNLINVFPSNLIQRLRTLEKLLVQRCNSLEVVFDFEGLNNHEEVHADVLLPCLESLKLKYLPNLRHMWKKIPMTIQGFENLKSLEVSWGDNLRSVLSIHMVKLLVKLQELIIINCNIVEEVVANDHLEEDKVAAEIIVFPSLRLLILETLPNLTSFSPKMKTLASTSPSTQSLNTINDALEKTQQHFLFYNQVEFPSLMNLELRGLCNINEIWWKKLPYGPFCKLKVLKLYECDKLLIVAPSQVLPTLEEVHVDGCASIEEVFEFEKQNFGQNPRKYPLARSHKHRKQKICAQPSHLNPCQPSRKAHTSSHYHSTYYRYQRSIKPLKPRTTSSQLKELTLRRLPRLMHLSKNGKVVFPNLKKLELIQLDSQFLINHQGALFENLVSLSVDSCETLRNIFSPSMARGIVHLRDLEIEDCLMMEDVVTKKGDEDLEEERIFFPQLKSVRLKYLPKLTSLCHVTCASEWPLLEEVIVIDCPELKTISLGSLSTPKLSGVELGRRVHDPVSMVWMGNLNNTIQHLHEGKVSCPNARDRRIRKFKRQKARLHNAKMEDGNTETSS